MTTLTPPTRFRAAEDRGAKIGQVLRLVGRVGEVDEELMTRIGQRFWTVDEAGERLAAAIRSKGDDRVRLDQFHRALARGIEAVPDAPAALVAFFAEVDEVPSWVDRDLMNRGAEVYRRLGRNAGDVLLQLSLIGGYRFGGPTDLLVATGGLTGDMTRRRLAETQQWTIAVTEHDAMLRENAGWKLTVHVRLMHALVNHRFDDHPEWDAAHWGRPINQSDQAATLGLFTGALLIGVRALGVRITREDSRAVMHLWKYIGWLMGVDQDWLFDTERDQHRLNYHVLRAQDDVTEAGAQLSASIVEAQRELHFRRFAGVRGRFAQWRLLSMLRPFLGRRGLQDVGLPVRLPWATALVLPANLWRYRVLARTSWGRARIDRWARYYRDEQMYRYFGDDAPDVGRLDA
ncbi:oxygenase MpaB family protein [Aeromicrobium alkaliterrae]|uniref:Oxygenase MpaB family protein n=1 Tax=Aeromicrobium alkaliterrae TaxID=302168 RepID=A0ABP4VMK2_9ACTN